MARIVRMTSMLNRRPPGFRWGLVFIAFRRAPLLVVRHALPSLLVRNLRLGDGIIVCRSQDGVSAWIFSPTCSSSGGELVDPFPWSLFSLAPFRAVLCEARHKPFAILRLRTQTSRNLLMRRYGIPMLVMRGLGPGMSNCTLPASLSIRDSAR